jgi:hypothetical protein
LQQRVEFTPEAEATPDLVVVAADRIDGTVADVQDAERA